MRYATLRKAIELNDELGKLTPVSEEEIAQIREEYPDIPEDYLDYLREIGYGEYLYGPIIYGGPIDVDSIFSKNNYPRINQNEIILFGDWGNGDGIGYMKEEDGYTIVEVLHETDSISEVYGDFEGLIEDRLYEYALDEDLTVELGFEEAEDEEDEEEDED